MKNNSLLLTPLYPVERARPLALEDCQRGGLDTSTEIRWGTGRPAPDGLWGHKMNIQAE